MDEIIEEDGETVSYSYTFPNNREVEEYNYHIEYKVPGEYESLIESIKQSGIMLGEFYASYDQFIHLIKSGLLKLVYNDATDEENYWRLKFWAALEDRYKLIDEFDRIDEAYLMSACRTVWSMN
jgi:hypothetical protein